MVKFIDNELLSIKKEILDMLDLVYNQLSRANQAMTTMNTDIANKIMVQEKLVNSYDLKIDSLIEDFIALYTPVAVDLRFVLAMLNINNNLERIGDYAESIARFVIRRNRETIERPLLEALRLDEMFEHVLFIVETAKRAMKEENIELANVVLEEDNLLDEINADALRFLVDYAEQHPDKMRLCLELNGVFRKLERTGDHINNTMEDIIFYLNAKVLKHMGKHE